MPPAFPADIRIAPALGVATGTAAGNQQGPAATSVSSHSLAPDHPEMDHPEMDHPEMDHPEMARPAKAHTPTQPISAKSPRKRKVKRRAALKKSRRARVAATKDATVAPVLNSPAPDQAAVSPEPIETGLVEQPSDLPKPGAIADQHAAPPLPVPDFTNEMVAIATPSPGSLEPALAQEASPPAIPLPPGAEIHALVETAPSGLRQPLPAPMLSDQTAAQNPTDARQPAPSQSHGRNASTPLPRNRSLARPPSGFIATISNWLGSALRLATLGLISPGPKRHPAPRKAQSARRNPMPGLGARPALRSAPPGPARIQPQAPPRQPSPPLREATELAQLRAENRRLRLELERLQGREGAARPSPAPERGQVGA